jgi:hypothetical protein
MTEISQIGSSQLERLLKRIEQLEAKDRGLNKTQN